MLTADQEAVLAKYFSNKPASAILRAQQIDERRLMNTRQAGIYLNRSQWSVGAALGLHSPTEGPEGKILDVRPEGS